LFEAVGFEATHAFAARSVAPSPPETGETAGVRANAYFDFAPSLTDRSAIRPLVENDPGVQARVKSLRDALAAWWSAHAARLADLPARRDLNAVRAEFLDSFVAALSPLNVLDRFKLSGVIATWWTETLPDFKTLLENGFPGVIDGWVDAIADAVEDDEAAGPIFDPFTHKLVRRVMSDYLDQIAAAKTDVARLKGEKEAFEQSNEPDDADEEELKSWNYAKDLERQIRELKAENRDALKELAKLEKATARNPSSKRKPPPLAGGDKGEGICLLTARDSLQPVLDQLAALEATLTPYEKIKADVSAARSRFGVLTNAFVSELKNRCGFMGDDKKRTLVLELLQQDVKAGLDSAANEKRQVLVRFVEKLRDKYGITLTTARHDRLSAEEQLNRTLEKMQYVG